MLSEGENHKVDFKKIPDGISAEDLVAFANSEDGGQILVGVVETSLHGAQTGEVRGCEVSDAAILQILNKASSCIPPVSVHVFIENLDSKPILRLNIPPSENKPHCTPKGIYCRREGTRTRPLHPGELLGIFLEKEARVFSARFEAAAEQITENISELESTLESTIKNMTDQLGWADFKLGDTEDKLDTALAQLKLMGEDVDDTSLRLRTLLEKDDKLVDPVRARERKKLTESIVRQLRADPKLYKAALTGKSMQVSTQGKAAKELTKDDLQCAYRDAVKIIRFDEEKKKYLIECKAPSRCTEDELDSFSRIVEKGGEVAAGIRARIEGAFRLGFVIFEKSIVGTAALKKPKAAYREKVFNQAKSKSDMKEYPYELGWIFLDEPHRKKGQMGRVIVELLRLAGEHGIFATTRSSNTIMKDILLHHGFKPSGITYPSLEHPNETIQLYVKDAPEQG